MHLAYNVNTLCIDEPNYEKAIKIFQEYANQEVFKRRLVSGQELNVLSKGREMPRLWTINKMSNAGKYYRGFSEKAERKLFAKTV